MVIRDKNIQRNLLGLRVEDWTFQKLINTLDDAIINIYPIHVWGISVIQFPLVKKFPEIIDFTKSFDIVVADGAGVPIFGKLLGQKISEHLGLPYVSEEMIKLAAQKGYSLLLFGATPRINMEAQQEILKRYPNINLLPGICGYFGSKDEKNIAKKIHDLKPDILLVGMSFPLKEKFLLRWKDYMKIPVSIACGGYFDVLAGKTRLAPKFLERMAMSWFWRFSQEPKRLLYRMLINAIIFVFYILPVSYFGRIMNHLSFMHIYSLMHIKNKFSNNY